MPSTRPVILSAFSQVVDDNKRWDPDWYSWLRDFVGRFEDLSSEVDLGFIVIDPTTLFPGVVFNPGEEGPGTGAIYASVEFTPAYTNPGGTGLGHAIVGEAIARAGTTTSGSIGGVIGGCVQYQAGMDSFGIAGIISSGYGVSGAGGVGLYAITRGACDGDVKGSIISHEAWYGNAGTALLIHAIDGLYWGAGVTIEGCRDVGFAIGNAGFPATVMPTFPFIYSRPTILPALIDIVNISKQNPCQITTGPPHNYTSGDTVRLYAIGGMNAPASPANQHISSLNGPSGIDYIITVVSPNVFSIPVDTTLYSNYIGHGTAFKQQANPYYNAFFVFQDGSVTCQDLNVQASINLQPASLAANGAVATALTAVGPTGSHTTVQEWMKVKGTGGATRWIPMF
jgi:hypothetical protein